MAVTTYTLAGNFDALIGEVSKLRATIHGNGEDDSWINETDLKIALGGGLLTVAADGTFTTTLPTSSGTGLQYEVRAEYVDNATRQRKTWRSGWFDLTANGNLATLANDSSLRVNPSQATILGGRIDDAEGRLDALEAGGGTEVLAAQMFGKQNHGNVSGAQTFNGPTASHRFTATGPTTITLAGYDDGMVATLICFSGADQVAVVDAGDVELVDNTAWSAELVDDVWISGGGGGTPAVPDTTPPTAVTGLSATGGEGQVSATWTAATDAESPVHYRWRIWLTSGGATGEWTSTDSLTFTKTGLAAGAYTVQVYAYSNGGASATASTTATATAPLSTLLTDTFTRPAGNLNDNPVADSGQTWSLNLYSSNITSGGKLALGALNTIPIGGSAKELTLKLLRSAEGGDTRISMSHDGTNSGEPMDQIVVTASGIVSCPAINGNVTFNISGTSNSYTATGVFAPDVEHDFRVTRNGNTVAVYVDAVKVLEGTATAAAGNYFACAGASGSAGAVIDNVVVKG